MYKDNIINGFLNLLLGNLSFMQYKQMIDGSLQMDPALYSDPQVGSILNYLQLKENGHPDPIEENDFIISSISPLSNP